ncbi:MAG: hypothetical protein WAN35_16280, partial [Terracidiphilus sp.]
DRERKSFMKFRSSCSFTALIFILCLCGCNWGGPNIYIAGGAYQHGDSVPTGSEHAYLWLDGSPRKIPGGVEMPINEINWSGSEMPINEINWSVASASGAGVIMAGAGYDSMTKNYTAMLWNNGTITNLTDGTEDAIASGIAVSGSDVYVAGTVADSTTNYPKAVYWKNGQEIALTEGSEVSMASAIAISGTDIYVAGEKLESWCISAGCVNPCCHAINDVPVTTFQGTYWKNGVEIDLPPNVGYSMMTTAIAISDGNVYVTGYQTNALSGPIFETVNLPLYWGPNGLSYLALFNSNITGMALSIAVSGEDVYVGGYESDGSSFACYWLNGNPTPIAVSDSTESALGSSIAVSGGDIYMAGQQWDASTHLWVPYYWKNGVGTALAADASEDGIASSIVVDAQQ